MADDTPTPTRFPQTPITLTVDEVRDALIEHCHALPLDDRPRLLTLIDALIAAVRAETLHTAITRLDELDEAVACIQDMLAEPR